MNNERRGFRPRLPRYSPYGLQPLCGGAFHSKASTVRLARLLVDARVGLLSRALGPNSESEVKWLSPRFPSRMLSVIPKMGGS